MYLSQDFFWILFLVLLAQGSSVPCLADICDLQLCEAEEYIFTASYTDGNDCCSVCGMSEADYSGSGYMYDCVPCNTSCTSCYGPANSQCYSCRNHFVVIQERESVAGLVCENGTVRNSSLNVLQCLDECPESFKASNDTMECTCPESHYLDSKGYGLPSCKECVNLCSQCVSGTQSGCLRCSAVRYGNECVEECPSRTVDMDGKCVDADSNSLFTLDRIAIFSIIGAVAFVILFCACWICCIIYCCIYKEMRRNNFTSEDGTAISESFKKVKRSISVKKRPPKIRTLSSENALRIQHLSQTFDPYLQPTQGGDTRQTPDYLELVARNNKDAQSTRESRDEEDVYMRMTPATSVEKLDNESSVQKPKNENVKLNYTHSLEPQTSAPPVSVRLSTASTSARIGGTHDDDDEQEVYVNPGRLNEENSQEDYVTMEHRDQYQPEDYMVPSQILTNSQGQEDTEEQELYEEMQVGGQPPVPSKSIIPPAIHREQEMSATYSYGQRKETLDNQYVKITGNDQKAVHKLKLKKELSNEQLNVAPKYVNVQRSGDPRLRSVTSPPMTSSKPPKAPKPTNQIENQPIYQNFAEEANYGNV